MISITLLILLYALLHTAAASPPLFTTPKSIAVFYGWPIAVNGYWNTTLAAQEFSKYDQVVFGAGLEYNSHPEHTSTVSIMEAVTSTSATKIYGYVDSTQSNSAINMDINRWGPMGVKGIFLDRFGMDFGLTRTKQNTILDKVHSTTCANGIKCIAFINAWNPDDVFSTNCSGCGGTAPKINPADWYLAAPHFVQDGNWQPTAEWEIKSNKMLIYKSQYNISTACVATSGATFSQQKWNVAYRAHALYSCNSSGWGEQFYSASSSTLPWRERLYINGTLFTSSINKPSASIFQRQTNVGVVVNTVTHSTAVILI